MSSLSTGNRLRSFPGPEINSSSVVFTPPRDWCLVKGAPPDLMHTQRGNPFGGHRGCGWMDGKDHGEGRTTGRKPVNESEVNK